jgi:hypothetical protein
MTTIAAIISAIKAALNADLGTYDFAGAAQVKEGTYLGPPGSQAFIALLPAEQTGAEPLARDGWYREAYELELRVWAPYASEDPEARAIATRAMVAEVKVALDTARHSATTNALGRCTTFFCREVQPDPSGGTASPSWLYATLRYEFTHNRLRGT